MFRDSDAHRHLLGDGASPSTATRSPRSRRSSTSRCSRATSASPAPACARCAATPTCRATGPWASGSGRKPALPRRAARRVRLRAAARARLRHRRGDPGAARRQGPGVLRDGRQLRLRGPRHRRHRGGDAQRRPHRARLDQAQPLPRRHRPRGADPPGARAAARRTAPAAASSGSPSRTRCRRCTPRRARSSPASTHLRSEVDIVCSLADGHARRRARHPVGRRSAPTTPRSGSRIARVVPGCAAYDEKVDQPGGFVLPHPPRDSPRRSRPRPGKAIFTVSPLEVLRRARGAAAAADAALPRPVQHHDLRPRRPLPRHQGRPPGGVRAPRRHRRTSGSHDGDHVDLVSEWHDGSERPRRDVPDRGLRPAARLRRGVLPGDQPAGPARLQGRGQQHPDLEVGDHPAGAARPAGAPASISSRRRATRPATSERRARSTES